MENYELDTLGLSEQEILKIYDNILEDGGSYLIGTCTDNTGGHNYCDNK